MRPFVKRLNNRLRDLRFFGLVLLACLGINQSAAADQARIQKELIEAFEAYALQTRGQHEQAFAAWMDLAKRGNPKGILNVANAYQEGRGVERDLAEAVRWYRKGADQGDPHCLYNLAHAYETGLGVRADQERADTYFERAAGAGSTDAQFMFARTLLVENKFGEARHWLERAAENGDRDAARLLSDLATFESSETASALSAEDRRRIAHFLDRLDGAANAGDAGGLTGAIDESAEIAVRLPGQSSLQRMTRAEYWSLWATTFERTERYRFTRTKFDEAQFGDEVRVRSLIREHPTGDDQARQLVLIEDLTVSLADATPRITKVLLKVEDWQARGGLY